MLLLVIYTVEFCTNALQISSKHSLGKQLLCKKVAEIQVITNYLCQHLFVIN
jgi:hypothetical protein